MLSFEQHKLIDQLELDMKELGLTVDYSEITTHNCIVFEAEGYNRIIIWLSNDCFLSLNLSNNPQFAPAIDAMKEPAEDKDDED